MTALELRVPPALVTAVFAGLMWLTATLVPSLTRDVPGRVSIAVAFFAAGAALALAGVLAFHRASTTVNPVRPEAASSLVTSGVYRVTRNPMYLGFLSALVGWGVWLAHPLPYLAVLLFVAYMGRFQIGPEERALRAAFGEAFEAYSRSTRRWL